MWWAVLGETFVAESIGGDNVSRDEVTASTDVLRGLLA